jgi:hypothetical protein
MYFISVEELYEFQKILFENIEDIFNTLNIHENLSEQLMNTYDNVILTQQNRNTNLEENLNKITPDENRKNNYLFFNNYYLTLLFNKLFRLFLISYI